MPEIGEYWYDAHRGCEVARIVAVEDDECAFLVVNSIVRLPHSVGDGRLIEMNLDEFLERYRQFPEIDLAWFEAGSIWFDRRDASNRVVIDSHGAGDTVAFRAVGVRDLGHARSSPRAAFSERYVRVLDNADAGLAADRYWVVGDGICAVFISRADAQAFLFEASALLNRAESVLEIRRVRHPARPPGRTGALAEVVHALGGTGGGGGLPGVSTGIGFGGGFGGGGLPGPGGIVMVSGGGGLGGIAPASPALPRPPEPPTLWERLVAPDE
jgi:hypothetical protein